MRLFGEKNRIVGNATNSPAHQWQKTKRNEASAGIDGMAVAALEKFSQSLDEGEAEMGDTRMLLPGQVAV